MTYGDLHRIFLQGIMTKGIMDVEGVKKLYDIAHKKCDVSEPDFSRIAQFVLTINDELDNEKMGMKIVKVLDEESLRRKAYYCLITTTDRSGDSNRLSKTAMAEFQAYEVEYLKVVADAIVMSGEEREVNGIEALNLCRMVKSRTVKQSEADKILARFVEAKWLAKTGGRGKGDSNGGYILSARFIAEMEPYLRQHYEEDIDECPKCQRVVVRGFHCHTCPRTVFHTYCLLGISEEGRANCTRCGKAIEIGSAAGSTQVIAGGKRKAEVRGPRRGKKKEESSESE